MKLFKVVLIIVTILLININFTNYSSALNSNIITENGVTIDILPENVNGSVTIKGSTWKDKLKILIIKDKLQLWYDVNLNEDGTFNEEIYLINGTGGYQVSVLVHLFGRTYSFGPTVNVNNTIEVNRFIVPTKHVESNHNEIILLAKKITKGLNTDREKAKYIYDWVCNNISYDYDKYLKQVNNNYDNAYGALNTLLTKKGVCYDFSTLLAALGRASGLQVKVIKGDFITNTSRELHAWNEIYISEENKWINVDSTFGYALRINYFDNKNFFSDHEKLEEY